MSFNELNGFRIEAALQFGFEMTNDDGDEYSCTEAQLLAFARACERKGRADAAKMARNSNRWTPGFSWRLALTSFADFLEKCTLDATDEQIEGLK